MLALQWLYFSCSRRWAVAPILGLSWAKMGSIFSSHFQNVEKNSIGAKKPHPNWNSKAWLPIDRPRAIAPSSINASALSVRADFFFVFIAVDSSPRLVPGFAAGQSSNARHPIPRDLWWGQSLKFSFCPPHLASPSFVVNSSMKFLFSEFFIRLLEWHCHNTEAMDVLTVFKLSRHAVTDDSRWRK